ncbi:MAG: protein phosphatase 2C domain-containing protein, partial [Tatlockia sp.]|nr:protein phosphatase 2C domain-containing protein [Tatlockia sp.]
MKIILLDFDDTFETEINGEIVYNKILVNDLIQAKKDGAIVIGFTNWYSFNYKLGSVGRVSLIDGLAKRGLKLDGMNTTWNFLNIFKLINEYKSETQSPQMYLDNLDIQERFDLLNHYYITNIKVIEDEYQYIRGKSEFGKDACQAMEESENKLKELTNTALTELGLGRNYKEDQYKNGKEEMFRAVFTVFGKEHDYFVFDDKPEVIKVAQVFSERENIKINGFRVERMLEMKGKNEDVQERFSYEEALINPNLVKQKIALQKDLDKLFIPGNLEINKNSSQAFISETVSSLIEKFELLQDESKYEVVLSIDERFQREKATGNEYVYERIQELKKEFINHANGQVTDKTTAYHNWKDALLKIDAEYQPLSRTYLQKKHVYPDIQQPISLSNERFNIFRKKNVSTISGSSFATDNKNRLEESLNDLGEPKEAAVLDGSFTASTSDGWVLAVADGCGHRDKESENEDIGRTSYFAAKNACRLMAGYEDADSLSESLTKLKERLSKELPVKVRAHRDQSLKAQRDQELEKTTLACGRAFQMENGDFRFVGLNIGDTMLIAYNPQTRKFETIAKARQILRGFGNGSPAALPDLCTEDQMITFDVTLPKGTIVFGLTDGVWDYLPIVQNSLENQ